MNQTSPTERTKPDGAAVHSQADRQPRSRKIRVYRLSREPYQETRFPVLLKRDVLNGIQGGKISLVFRRWKRPTVRAGGTLRTAVGVLAIDAVDELAERDVTDRDARRAGFRARNELLEEINSGRRGTLYRIRLHYAGADPRVALRRKSNMTKAELADVTRRLSRLDAVSRSGAWTLPVLELIQNLPGVRAGDLAASLAFDKESLKIKVRKLKELGLTESLQPGYRLSPRGRTLLQHLQSAR